MAATTKTEPRARGPKLQSLGDRDQQKLAALRARLGEALEQQAATSEILRVIRSSPADVQPVFETIARKALALCGSFFANVFRYDGKLMHYAASHLVSPEQIAIVKQGYPAPPSRGRVAGRAILSRAVVCIEDALADADYDHPVAAAAGWRRMFAVPMLRDGEPLGAIAVGWTEPGSVPVTQQELLKTFADQAVIAIENARLFEETKSALEQQTAISEILRVISNSPTDVTPVLEAVVERAMRICESPDARIFLVEGDRLRHAAGRGDVRAVDIGASLPLERGLVMGRAVIDKVPVHVEDLAAASETEFPLGRQVAQQFGHRTTLGVPLLREQQALGVILLRRAEVRPFSSEQIALLKTFADQAAIAIENVRLFNETKEALERQTATAEILKVISSSPTDVQPVFDAIAENGVQLCNAGFGNVFRFDGDLITLVAHHGSSEQELEGLRRIWPMRPHMESIVGRAILERRVIHVRDYQADFPKYAPLLPTIRSIVEVPMLRAGEPIGVLSIYRREVAPFAEQQIDLLKTFADQAVIAIENVRLFNETKEALERQTATADILRVISSSPTDTQPVFDAIARNCVQLFGGMNAAVTLVRDDKVELGAFATASEVLSKEFEEFFPLPLTDESASGRAILKGDVIQVYDMQTDPLISERVKSLAQRMGFRAMLTAPMIREGRAIGAINVQRATPGWYTDKQVTQLRSFADQAVIAIENVRLFKELEARTEALGKSVQQLTALGEVGQAISSTLDLETVLKTIVQRSVQLTGLDGGEMFEYDEPAEQFHLRAAENLGAEIVELLRRTPLRKGEGAVGRAGMTGEPTEIPEILDDSYQSRVRELLVDSGHRALLAVPLLCEGHLLGALVVNRKSPGRFAAETVELLKTFATQSALAIQNARLFREIAEKGRQLEEASKHKSRFLASMSHELRTPLNAILGFNEMILGEIYGAVPADMKGPLEDIQASGKHLLRLINNVLDLAKIEAGRMELALADYSVHDTVESVRSTLRPLAAEKGLEFLASVPNEMPLAYGDSGRITQCLMNLAGNSLKFTKQGKVEISVALKETDLVYCVADTGIGIPPEKIGSLFTEFKQTDATIASEYGGSGLGLSIVKKFVEMHGGRIWAESELGRGSSFLFQVPLRTRDKAAA